MRIVVVPIALVVLLVGVTAAEHHGKRQLDQNQIARIEIAKQGHLPRQLDSDQSKAFVQSWNQSAPKGLCKYTVEYWIRVHLTGGELITYRTNGQYIKAEDDYCFTVEGVRFFESLWNLRGQ